MRKFRLLLAVVIITATLLNISAPCFADTVMIGLPGSSINCAYGETKKFMIDVYPSNIDLTKIMVLSMDGSIVTASISGKTVTLYGRGIGWTDLCFYYDGEYITECQVNVGNMPDGLYHIVSRYDSGSNNMEVSSKTGTLHKNSAATTLNQLWFVKYATTGYTIMNMATGRYLTHTANPTVGEEITQSTNPSSNNARWTFTQSGAGYIIRPYNSTTLSINSAGANNIVYITNYSGTGMNNKWFMYHLDANMIGIEAYDNYNRLID